MKKEFAKLFINNTWVDAATTMDVKSPYDDHVVGTVGVGNAQQMKQAIDAAEVAFQQMKNLPVYKIAEGLEKMKQYLLDNLEEIAQDLSAEAGKPITVARAEVNRALHTFEDGVEESKRMYGEILPMDRRPWGEQREGQIQRFPIGVIAAITPFNFPLNLVAHKVVPALASKNTVVVRPASQTPVSSLHLAKAYEASGLPAGGLNVVPSDYEAADVLSGDDNVKMVSFTGSAKVGQAIREKIVCHPEFISGSPKEKKMLKQVQHDSFKKIALELGGNAAVVIHEDCSDLTKAASAVATGGFINAGQSCISAQRIFVHKKIYDEFVTLLKEKVDALVVGDPQDEKTQVASLINSKEADRIMDWIEEAKSAGATIVAGGTREGNVIRPTILANTTNEMKVNCMEIFGPLVTVVPYENFDDVLKEVNNSQFGLQAGIFTQNVTLIHKAYQTLEVGGLIINDVPTWRIDHMPYGGIKMSGIGREGVRFAMQEMTEPKLLVIAY